MRMAATPRPPTGIDLGDPVVYAQVRRMFFGRFARVVTRAGLDEDDALQDVLLALHRRQRGRSAFDPRRAPLNAYLFLAVRGIVANLVDKARRGNRRLDGGIGIEDHALSAQGDATGMTRLEVEQLAAEMGVPVQVVQALADGEDVVIAALDAGMTPVSAARLGHALGVR